MKRRNLVRSAAGLGGLSQFPRWAAAVGSGRGTVKLSSKGTGKR
jgi:hypothetical protein